MPATMGWEVSGNELLIRVNDTTIARFTSGGLILESGKSVTVPAQKLIVGTTTVGATVASGTQQSTISDPAAGGTVDAEARTAINAIIDALQAFKIVA